MKGATRLNLDTADDGIMFYTTNRSVIVNSEPNMIVGVGEAIIEYPFHTRIDPCAEGSQSVTINGKPAVRSGDKTVGGAIATGSESVFIN